MILYNRVPKVAMIFGELLKAFLKTKRRREGEKRNSGDEVGSSDVNFMIRIHNMQNDTTLAKTELVTCGNIKTTIVRLSHCLIVYKYGVSIVVR